MTDILDYQAQHYLRKYIRRLSGEQYRQLKSVLYCNENVNPAVGAVFVMANSDEQAHYHGHLTCKNTWCCPVCSALMMSHYRERIDAAIGILKPTHFGFMVTFTIPHLGFMGWRESLDILYDAHAYFRLKSFKKGCGHAYHEFNKLYPVEHSVKAGEFTWSKKNGAHPHFHAIWWIPRDKFSNDDIVNWEDELGAFWLKTVKRKAIEYWRKHNLHANILKSGETLEDLADRVFAGSDRCYKQLAFYMSKDENGNLIEAVSGDYIAGWGTDCELTGNRRKEASHEGHMTPHQMLVASYSDKELQREYIDFCLAVTQKPVRHRVRFSQSGIVKRIDVYLKEQSQRESKILQKKSEWEVVTYFDENEWYALCDLDDSGAPVLANILWFAAHRRDLLADYLQSLGFEMHTGRHRRQCDVEESYDIAV